MRILLCFLLMAMSLCAEFRVIEMTVLGMDCVSCVTGLNTKLKRLRGVEAVEVLPERNLVTLKLAAGNSVRIDRVRDDIKAVGFSPKDALVTVVGSVNAQAQFTPAASTVMFQLSGVRVESGEQITLQAKQPLPATPQETPKLEVISAKRD